MTSTPPTRGRAGPNARRWRSSTPGSTPATRTSRRTCGATTARCRATAATTTATATSTTTAASTSSTAAARASTSTGTARTWRGSSARSATTTAGSAACAGSRRSSPCGSWTPTAAATAAAPPRGSSTRSTTGAHVINASYGTSAPTEVEREAIAYAAAHDTLIVAAAGNDHENTDKHPHYPAAYPDANVISVAASDEQRQAGVVLELGQARRVDLAAPGDAIASTCDGGDYELHVRHQHGRAAGGGRRRDAAQAGRRAAGRDASASCCSSTPTTRRRSRARWPAAAGSTCAAR